MQYGLVKIKGQKSELIACLKSCYVIIVLTAVEDPVPLKKQNAAFHADDDDNETPVASRKPLIPYKEISSIPDVEDPSVCDYDGQYDSFKPSNALGQRKEVEKSKDEPVSSTYIVNI